MSGAAIQLLNAPRIPPSKDRRRQVFVAGGFASIIGVDDKSAFPAPDAAARFWLAMRLPGNKVGKPARSLGENEAPTSFPCAICR